MTHQHHSWMIDAISDDAVRIEVDGDRVMVVPSWLLPFQVREGDMLHVSHLREAARSVIVIDRDTEATRLNNERSERQLADMPLESGPGGDVVL